MMRKFIFIVTLFCIGLCYSARAQQVFTIKGVISKKLSTERVAQVLITNLRTKAIIVSDELGWFRVQAAIGDTLLFKKYDFTDQKIAITSSNDLPVYMQPVIKLNEVKVQGQSKKQEVSEVMKEYRSQGTFYDGKPPILSFLTSPITGFYELFGSTPGRARRFAAFSKSEIEYAEVQRRYNPPMVKRVTNAPDSTVKKFMKYYTPSYQDLQGWNDYELIKHIRTSYEYYDRNKDRLKLDEVNSPSLMHSKTSFSLSD
jgi:hypothetical protein